MAGLVHRPAVVALHTFIETRPRRRVRGAAHYFPADGAATWSAEAQKDAGDVAASPAGGRMRELGRGVPAAGGRPMGIVQTWCFLLRHRLATAAPLELLA